MTTTRTWKITLAAFVAFAGSMGVIGLAPRGAAAAPKPVKGDVEQGKALYEQKCAVCHGAEGKGDGPAEFVLFPKPRNFTSGLFKLRSTTTVASDADLFKTIKQGIPGTAMPSWAALSDTQRWNLVAYIRSLAPQVTEDQIGPPIAIPTPPPPSEKVLTRGKQVFMEAGCKDCHGPSGRGDGKKAARLKDDWGYAIVPYDFTIPGRMKGGSTIQDVYRTLTAGIGGTPMPSFVDSIDEQERWDVGYYVLSLAGKPAAKLAAQEATTIHSRFVAGALPIDPSAPLWQRAKPVAIRMRTLWLRPKETESVRVASFHNGRQVGILLEWDNPIINTDMLRPQDFRDAAAVEFPIQRGEPSYTMGAHEGLVNIWHWKADWQADLDRYRDVQDRYPNMVVDFYPFLRGGPQSDPVRVATAAHDRTYLTGWGAKNLFSTPARLTSVEDLNAIGPGTLTSQPPQYQIVKGHGLWADGKWRVVMIRELRTDNARDVQLAAGSTVPVAFAVWDGAEKDRNGGKAVTIWQKLILDRAH